MESLASQVWVVLAVVGAVAVLSVLQCVAASIQNATYMHDLKVKVATLRRDRLAQMKEISEDAVTEVGLSAHQPVLPSQATSPAAGKDAHKPNSHRRAA